ncbi:19292_t:CDS:2, partial [Gigaspora margarita]
NHITLQEKDLTLNLQHLHLPLAALSQALEDQRFLKPTCYANRKNMNLVGYQLAEGQTNIENTPLQTQHDSQALKGSFYAKLIDNMKETKDEPILQSAK